MTKKNTTKSGKLSESQKLQAIRQRLRTGDISAISRKTGYHSSHVARVIHGESRNPSGEIVNSAYEMTRNRKVKA
jgi:hypothetical protein